MAAEIPKGLEPIESKNAATRYLRYAVKFRNPIACTVGKGEFAFEAQALRFEGDMLVVDILPPLRDQLTPEALNFITVVGTDITLSYSVGEVLLFIKTRLLNRKGGNLELEVTPPLLKLQRRGALRAKVYPQHGGEITLGGDTHGLFDISVGGASVVGHTPLLVKFPLQKTFDCCLLRFGGMETRISIVIMSHTQSKKNADNWKIGFKFLNLPKGAEAAIAKEAYQQTQDMWARLV